MINFKKCLIDGEAKTFCELMNDFYQGKMVEIHCGQNSEELKLDKISVTKPGILVGEIIGGVGTTLVVNVKKIEKENSSKIVCLQEVCIVMVTEMDGQSLESYFMSSATAKKVKK